MAGANFDQGRLLELALGHGNRAAGVKAASGRRIYRGGGIPFETGALTPGARNGHRYRFEQRLRVRVKWVREYLFRCGFLYDLA
jgi:hypothetical protein